LELADPPYVPSLSTDPILWRLFYEEIWRSRALQSQTDRDPRWLMLILWLIGVVAPVGFAIWLLYAAYYWPARLHEMRAPRAISQGDALRTAIVRLSGFTRQQWRSSKPIRREHERRPNVCEHCG
jgi:hypothetical protein